jgi:hypothetical protein
VTTWGTTRSVIAGVVAGLLVAGALVASAYKPAGRYPEDDGTLSALERAVERGVPDGVWRLSQPTKSRERTFAADPEDPTLTLYWRDDEKFDRVHAVARREFAETWFGDIDLFRRNYRPAGPARTARVGEASAVIVDWTIPGCPGCGVRSVAVERGTGLLLRVEDLSPTGRSLRTLELKVPGVHPSKVIDTPAADLAAAREEARRAGSYRPRVAKGTHTWAEFVAQVPLAIYEPTLLPRGFERVDYSFRDDAPRVDPEKRPMNVAGVTFGDGMSRMLLIFAKTEDLQRLDDLSRRLPQGPEVCAPLQNEPEERIEGDSAIQIFRRANLCRTLHRREFPDTGVSVALLSFGERDASVYVETLRSLVRSR